MFCASFKAGKRHFKMRPPPQPLQENSEQRPEEIIGKGSGGGGGGIEGAYQT
jgi:hypothetical protein